MYNVDILTKRLATSYHHLESAVCRLRSVYPHMLDKDLENLYNYSVIIHREQAVDTFLEDYIADMLTNKGFKFVRNAYIDDYGRVAKEGTFVDFIVGTPKIGDNISKFSVISCYTWVSSLKFYPKMFIFATLTNDYPSAAHFMESDTRKIVTATPRPDDDRKFRLNFNDILYCI